MPIKDYVKETMNNPLKQIEMQIGFTSGILIGVIASGILVIFIIDWAWYFKLFTAIGEAGLIGSLLLQLYSLIKARDNYLEVNKQMDFFTKDCETKIEKKTRKKRNKKDIIPLAPLTKEQFKDYVKSNYNTEVKGGNENETTTKKS